MSGPKTILLTGATGNVGATVLEQLLHSWFKVRAVIRSIDKSKKYFEDVYGPQLAASQLTLIEIPDLAVPGVFDKHVKGVDAIIHIATPIAFDNFMEKVIEPAWKINENILKAASASGTVKRIVITGSIVSTLKLPEQVATDITITEEDFNPITLEEAVEGPGRAYQYSKVSSEKKSWAFIKDTNPSFDLIFLLVPSILGRSIQPNFQPSKTNLGGIASVYQQFFDRKTLGFQFPYFMDVHDVARVHLRALQPDVPGNERYLLHAGVLLTNRIAASLLERYPVLRARVPEPGEGEGLPVPLFVARTDKADAVFGREWKGAWESVDATVRDILEFEAQNGGPMEEEDGEVVEGAADIV